MNEAQCALLGLILRDPENLYVALERGVVTPAFENPDLRSIWEAMIEANKAGREIDVTTIGMAVKPELMVKVVELTETAPLGQNCEAFADEVVSQHWQRHFGAEFSKMANRIVKRKPFEPVAEICAEAAALADRAASGTQRALKTRAQVKDLLEGYTKELERRIISHGDGKTSGITTGFKSLDNCFGGWTAPGVYTLAARPRIGKTTLVVGSFILSAAKAGKWVAFLSTEMGQDQLIDKMVSSDANVPGTDITSGGLTERNMDLISESCMRLYQLPITMPDFSSRTMDTLEAECRLRKRRNELDLIIVENLQQLIGSKHYDSKYLEVSEITGRLKGLAKKLHVPIIALCHINREAEKSSRAPRLSDLKDSSSIENDSDVVMLMYREDDGRPDDIVINVAKNRFGSEGMVYLKADLARNRFYERGIR
jgi:replicative DNA helicase